MEKTKPRLEQEEVFIDEVSSIFPDISSMENEISIDIDEKLPDLTTPIEIRNGNTTIKTWDYGTQVQLKQE
ncbi:MAG: hypothetical protein ACTTKD_10460 [Peptoanaerobacter stomatis]|uniref:hypothetical protein n=1 Tax=Peptoanaerobacter stomatis TaxID=796937 RepID=UPI003F9EE9D5